MKTTEQLAESHYKPAFDWYAFTAEELEAFRAACIKDYFESAEPAAWVNPRLHGDIEWNSSFPILNGSALSAAPEAPDPSDFAEAKDELLSIIFQSARYQRPSTDAHPALDAFCAKWLSINPAQDAKDDALKMAREAFMHMLINHPPAKNLHSIAEAIAVIDKAMKEQGK